MRQSNSWALLVCPITKKRLIPATQSQYAQLAKQAGGEVNDTVQFLVTDDGYWAYPVIDGRPHLLEPKRIQLTVT